MKIAPKMASVRSFCTGPTQSAKDCGPHNIHFNTGKRANIGVLKLVFTQLKPYFNVCAVIFFSEFLHVIN